MLALNLLGIVAVLAIAAALVLGLIFYAQFCRSPEKAWCDQVFTQLDQVRQRLAFERKERAELQRRYDADRQGLRDKARDQLLQDISVGQLDAYPGIGPATLAKLEAAGYKTLADLHGAHLDIPGVGEKRLADLGSAVRDLVRQAQSRLEAGACPQPQDLAASLAGVALKYQALELRLQAREQAAEVLLEKLQTLAEEARQITFVRYCRIASGELLPRELLEAPLPNLESALQAAEEQARAEVANRRQKQLDRPKTARAVPVASVVAAPGGWQTAASAPLAIPVAAEETSKPAPAARRPRAPSAAPLPEEPHVRMLELTLQFALAAARVDGPVSAGEREVIDEHLRSRYSYDAALHNRAKALRAHYETAAIDLETCLREIARQFNSEHQAALVDFAQQILAASGGMTPAAQQFLTRVCFQLGVAPPRTPKPAPPPRESYLAALEIEPAAPLSADLVRRQFNLLSGRYQPDKVRTMGAEFVAMSQGKAEAVRVAATALLAELGEPLEPPAAPPANSDLRHNPDLDAIFGA